MSRDGTDPRLARLAPAAGLCAGCANLELLDSGRSVFVFCALSRTDSRFRRYPPLPVIACAGFRPRDEPDDPAT